MLQTNFLRPVLVFTLLCAAIAPAAAKPLDPSVSASLATIKRDADAIASGRYRGKSLQGPAHEIGVAWYNAARVLTTDGDVLVETKMTNASIAKFEADWRNETRARAEAKDVSARIAELVSAAHS
jgi:hypothetical protein